MSEPPAGLDDIGWAGLDHAYGSAEDVPDLEILGVWGVPADHDECRRYAGLA
ncbi:hypothetical protein [Actinomadura monticuli]|uniref:Uncharacterized protein n=1 Tax=Actinomadura monticuli TaxID=3097367 RepID=A0ABV4QA37_9ACTN